MEKTKLTDKLFGGIKMSWLKVIIFAVASALLTAIFLILPVFKDTSFREMGTTFEAWILFAIIIMTNCEKPLESALKTFVFFLISQPLIYLFQVPFYDGGFQIFMYYEYWFIATLLTFPMAFVGWFLKRRDWISLLILSPVILFLALSGTGYTIRTIENFPNHIIAALFCFGQIILYLYALFGKTAHRLVIIGLSVLTIVVSVIMSFSIDVSLSTDLDEIDSLGASATAVIDDPSYGEVKIMDRDDPYVFIHMVKRGTVGMTITDDDKEYEYVIYTYRDNGLDRIEVKPKE